MILFINFITSLFSPSRPASAARTGGPRANDPTSPIAQTTDQYTGRTQTQRPPQQEPQQEQPQRSFWGRVWGAVRSTAVVLAATVVTGALIASGVGIVGVALAIGAGILAGTAVGTVTNAATCLATGDWSKFGQTFIEDLKSSSIGAVSTACGFGVARLVTGGAQAAATVTAGTRLLGAASAGASGATVSTVIGTADQLHQANQEFTQHIEQKQREEGRTLTQREIADERQRFMEERKLTMAQILRGGATNIVTGALSGGVGARFQAARQGVQSSLAQGLNATRGQVLRSSIAAEATVLAGIGMGSSVVSHGELTLEESIQHIGSSYAGGYIGNRVNHMMERRAQAARAQQAPPPPRNGSSPPQSSPRTSVPHSELPPEITTSNAFRHANRNGRSIVIEIDTSLPATTPAQAEVRVNPNGTRTTVIRVRDRAQLNNTNRILHEVRHSNRTVTEVHLRDANGNITRTRTAKEYVALRALEEFQVRAARAPGEQLTPTHRANAQYSREMQRLIANGDHQGAIKYARRNGINQNDLRNYGRDYAENRANPNRIVQRGNSTSTAEDLVNSSHTLDDLITARELSGLTQEQFNPLAEQRINRWIQESEFHNFNRLMTENPLVEQFGVNRGAFQRDRQARALQLAETALRRGNLTPQQEQLLHDLGLQNQLSRLRAEIAGAATSTEVTVNGVPVSSRGVGLLARARANPSSMTDSQLTSLMSAFGFSSATSGPGGHAIKYTHGTHRAVTASAATHSLNGNNIKPCYVRKCLKAIAQIID